MASENIAFHPATVKKNIIKTIIHPTIEAASSPAKKHIAVVMGGMSAEREVSLSSAKGIIEHLQKLNYRVTPVDMGQDIADVLLELNPDVVFNALHGTYGEDGCLQGILDVLDIPYTHSGVLASAIGMDKLKSRALFTSNGIKCPEHILINKSDNYTSDPIPRPYVIKPVHEGSSIGVHVIFKEDNFDIRDYDFTYGETAIIEKYIKGKEIQVAVIGDRAIGAIEIIPKGRFYDYTAKYTDGMAEHIMPAPLSESAQKKALELAEKAHKLLGCRGVSRADFLYDEAQNEFFLLEMNTHPGMTPLSLVPEICAYYGISFADILEILIKEARCKG
jgi:D-alanine-D-alanine ligase